MFRSWILVSYFPIFLGMQKIIPCHADNGFLKIGYKSRVKRSRGFLAALRHRMRIQHDQNRVNTEYGHERVPDYHRAWIIYNYILYLINELNYRHWYWSCIRNNPVIQPWIRAISLNRTDTNIHIIRSALNESDVFVTDVHRGYRMDSLNRRSFPSMSWEMRCDLILSF